MTSLLRPRRATSSPCIPSAPLIAAIRMQRSAQEMNFPRPRSCSRRRPRDVRMRIFTPGKELPVAGHPTIGTTFALAKEGVIAPGREECVFELGIGPIPVALEWGAAGLSFAWMTQPLPSFGARIADRAGLAEAIGLDESDLEELPIEEGPAASVLFGRSIARRGRPRRVTAAGGPRLRVGRIGRLRVFCLHHDRPVHRRRDGLQPMLRRSSACQDPPPASRAGRSALPVHQCVGSAQQAPSWSPARSE